MKMFQYIMKFFCFFLMLIFFKEVYSFNLYEKFAFALGGILIIDQHFDTSLDSKQVYDKKKDVFNKSLLQKKKQMIYYKPNSQADMIMILDITEELNIQNNYLK